MKILYITLFTFLGVLLGFLIHTAVEIPVISLLVSDIEKWGLGISWDGWFVLHGVWSAVTLFFGAFFGFKLGKHWWRVMYE